MTSSAREFADGIYTLLFTSTDRRAGFEKFVSDLESRDAELDERIRRERLEEAADWFTEYFLDHTLTFETWAKERLAALRSPKGSTTSNPKETK